MKIQNPPRSDRGKIQNKFQILNPSKTEKRNFLLEIGVEEIPARFLQPIIEDCAVKAKQILSENRLSFEDVKACGTMRRIVLFIEGLKEKQDDLVQEVKGPPKSAAFDENNSPTAAAQGFAASQKATLKDLVVKDVNGREYIFVSKREKGAPAINVLKGFIPKLVSSLYLPISMRWGNSDFAFIRPIHYVLALYGRDKVKTKVGDVVSSNKTISHRFLCGNKTLAFKADADLDAYKKFLMKAGVVLDGEDRKNRVMDQLRSFELEVKEKIMLDEELLVETSDLVENPRVLRGRFNRQFIADLPQDVIATVVRKQQKCFPVPKSGYFLIVADGGNRKEIISGYEQVINARLSDAKFFYDEDIKSPPGNNLERMKKIIYHEKIGSMWDKMRRVVKLSNYIAGEALNQKSIIPVVERIAELSKADLTTHMVGEFGSLAGIMGREYSLVAGEDPRVARGIFEHYLPRFSKDALPEDIPGAVVGIADRMDSLVGYFSSGIIPTGSQDPYGIRRAAQGIVSLIIGKNLELPISQLVDKSMEIYGVQNIEAKDKLLDFFRQRVKAVLESENVRYDVADAVLNGSVLFVESYCKAFEIMRVLEEPWFKSLVLTSDRIERICSGKSIDHVVENDFIEEGEKSLFNAYCRIRSITAEHLSRKNYKAALRALRELTEPAGIFFEKILVMHEDKKIQANRLALLKSLENLYLQFADFPKIVI